MERGSRRGWEGGGHLSAGAANSPIMREVDPCADALQIEQQLSTLLFGRRIFTSSGACETSRVDLYDHSKYTLL